MGDRRRGAGLWVAAWLAVKRVKGMIRTPGGRRRGAAVLMAPDSLVACACPLGEYLARQRDALRADPNAGPGHHLHIAVLALAAKRAVMVQGLTVPAASARRAGVAVMRSCRRHRELLPGRLLGD